MTCKYCGAATKKYCPEYDEGVLECGTEFCGEVYARSHKCKNRQITQQGEELERLRDPAFQPMVELITTFLKKYPDSVFPRDWPDGKPRDSGPRFVTKLKEALEVLKETSHDL